MDTLLVLAPVAVDALPALAAVLTEIGTDPVGNPHVRFPDSPRTHFARWNLVTDDDHGTRLLFAAGFDGDLDSYLDELVGVSPGLDAVYGACEGYEGPARFGAFVVRHRCRHRGVYRAFPDDTVADLRRAVETRDELQRFLDLPDVARYLSDPGVAPLLDRLGQVPGGRSARSVRRAREQLRPKLQRAWRTGFIPFAKVFAGFGQARAFDRVHAAPVAAPAVDGELAPAVSTGAGCHDGLTLLMDVADRRHARLSLALVLSNALTQHGYGDGEFADIGTITWFAWAVVDDGKRLLFASVYDGSWSMYVQDFVDKLQWGLDAIFGNAAGYPAAGMKDVAGFASFMGERLVPARALYVAQPDETVLTLIRARTISRQLAGGLDRSALEQWLQLL